MNIPTVLTAFKTALASLGVQVTDYVPDSPNVPSIAVYAESWPFARSEDATFVLWCVAGTVDMEDAQNKLMTWLSDDAGSIAALLDANSTLSGAVSSVLPYELRNWGIMAVQEGRPRLVQAELVVKVLR